ncbi:hypothetical protein BAE44_0001590, partial [Dichanthelium oligosanthes]
LILLNLTSPLWLVHAAATCKRWRRIIASSPAVGVDSRHFSITFIPGGSASWELVDSRGSLLLFAKKKSGWRRHCFPDLLACEPVTQRYHVIPLMAENKYHHCLGVYLHEDESIPSMTCVLFERYAEVFDDAGTVSTCVFSLNRRAGWSSVLFARLIGIESVADSIHDFVLGPRCCFYKPCGGRLIYML